MKTAKGPLNYWREKARISISAVLAPKGWVKKVCLSRPGPTKPFPTFRLETPTTNHLRRTLFPLPGIERQPALSGLKSNLASLWEIKHITSNRVDLLAGLVRDVEGAGHDNLHLMVRVLVDEWSAGL